MKKYTKSIAMVVTGLACSALTSTAALSPLTPGGAGVTPPAIGSLAGGTQVGTTLTSTYSFGSGADQGTIQSLVYSGVTANTLGGLTFAYIITVTAGDISAVGLSTFPLANILVGTIAGGTASSSADFTAGGTVNFHWVPSVLTAGTPTEVIVGTSATGYQVGAAVPLDTYPGSVGVPAYVPVPEPTTVVAGALMLLPFGMGAIRSLRKDRTA